MVHRRGYSQRGHYRLSPKLTHKIPGSLIAIIVMTVGVYLLKQYGIATQVETIGDRFMIKAELPGMNVPN